MRCDSEGGIVWLAAPPFGAWNARGRSWSGRLESPHGSPLKTLDKSSPMCVNERGLFGQASGEAPQMRGMRPRGGSVPGPAQADLSMTLRESPAAFDWKRRLYITVCGAGARRSESADRPCRGRRDSRSTVAPNLGVRPGAHLEPLRTASRIASTLKTGAHA